MFQNDFNFFYRDFTLPLEDPLEKVTQLKEEHDGNSTACPFLLRNELAFIQREMPKSWSLEIDESMNVSPGEVRVTIYNKYEEADRYLDRDLENVRLKAEPVGGDYLCVSQVYEQDGKWSDTLFELDSASGSSPIMIMITPGAELKAHSWAFRINQIKKASEVLRELI
jgi:hypothetical protein